MKKSYIKSDPIYAKLVSNSSTDELIQYLENIIDHNQNILSKNGSLISKLNRLDIVETIEAAQKEIKYLNTIKNTKKIN